MTRTRLLLCTLVLLLLPVTSAHAQPAPGGEAGAGANPDGTGTVSAGVTVPGGSGGPGASTQGGTTSSQGAVTFYWRTVPGSSCAGLGAEAVGVGPPELFEFVSHDRSTDPPTIEVLQDSCFPPEDAPETPPPPPPPPTLAEINAVAQENIPRPLVTLSPAGEGLTGLPTLLWSESPTEVSATATIRGYAVTATTWPAFRWDTGETWRPGHLLWSPVPGSAAAPAQTWTYESKGQYDLVHTVAWNGEWTFTGEGMSATGTLETVELAVTRAYTVNGIRSVLKG